MSLREVCMRVRGWAAILLAAPEPAGPIRRRDTWTALALGAALGAWIFAYKLRCFLGLGTTSDLFETEQLSRSWLHGRLLEDHCFGHVLAIHTYLFTPLLAVFTLPLGAVGLLAVAALAAAAAFVAMVRILGLLGVPFGAALAAAGVLAAAPLPLGFYQDPIYGFHVELVLPALGLWFAYFAIKRRWRATLVLALAIISVKEDAPLCVAAIGVLVACEDAIRGVAPGARPGGAAARSPVNLPALAAAALALAAIPVLLHVIRANASPLQAVTGFGRLRAVDGSRVSDGALLFSFVARSLPAWLTSRAVSQWLALAVPATFGLIALRPHALGIGLPLTLVSWLMVDDLLWPPRLAITLTFLLVAAVLGFASAWGAARRLWAGGAGGRLGAAAVAAAALLGLGLGLRAQWRLFPAAGEVYAMSPRLPYSQEDRARAAALFAIYRRDGKPDEPVVAVPYLFRYTQGRNLYWCDRLENQPQPIWILWDDVANPVGDRTDRYDLVGKNGRFSLYRKKGA